MVYDCPESVGEVTKRKNKQTKNKKLCKCNLIESNTPVATGIVIIRRTRTERVQRVYSLRASVYYTQFIVRNYALNVYTKL